VALAEPFGNGSLLRQLLAEISGTTGLLTVGPMAQRVVGPVIVVVEDAQQLPGMLRTAERIAALDGSQIVLLLVAGDEDGLALLEGQARLLAPDRDDLRIESAEVARGEAAVIAEGLRRRRGGFVICQFGGLIVPDAGDLRPLAGALECPLLLVR
jgi:hypothetical protein